MRGGGATELPLWKSRGQLHGPAGITEVFLGEGGPAFTTGALFDHKLHSPYYYRINLFFLSEPPRSLVRRPAWGPLVPVRSDLLVTEVLADHLVQRRPGGTKTPAFFSSRNHWFLLVDSPIP